MKYQDNGSDSDDVAIHVIRLLERSSTRGVERATFQNSNRLRSRENPFPSSDVNLIPNLFWISSWIWRQSIQLTKHSALCCSCESSLMTTKTALDRSIVLWVPQRPPTVRSEQQKSGQTGWWKFLDGVIDSPDVVLVVIRLLSREQHNALCFVSWIDCLHIQLEIPNRFGIKFTSELGNGFSR